MSRDLTIGVDIGGTKMAFVVADRAGAVYESTTLATPSGDNFPDAMDRIASLINRYLKTYATVCGIGIGLPGPVDTQRGIALHAANLGWQHAPVREAISNRLTHQLPIRIANDVNAGAIGEHRYGAAKGIADFVYFAIGTGVGGAVMIDNRLLRGASASEMEIGHISLDPENGRLCTCGRRGCLEMSISGKALLAHTRQHLAENDNSSLFSDQLTTRAIIRAAESQDPLATHVMQAAAEALGIAISWCITLFNPKLLILGGGLLHAAWHIFKPHTLAVASERCLPVSYDAAKISLAQLADGALGASALVWYYKEEVQRT